MNSNRPAANFETFKECIEYHLGPALVNKHYDKISLWYSQGSSVEGAVFRINEIEKDPEDWGTIPAKHLTSNEDYDQVVKDREDFFERLMQAGIENTRLRLNWDIAVANEKKYQAEIERLSKDRYELQCKLKQIKEVLS